MIPIAPPTSGLFVSLNQDVAGVGGDVNFIKTTGDIKYYQEVMPDVIGLTHIQGGHATGWGGEGLRMLDHFQGGPSIVRGFQPAGFGPRDPDRWHPPPGITVVFWCSSAGASVDVDPGEVWWKKKKK